MTGNRFSNIDVYKRQVYFKLIGISRPFCLIVRFPIIGSLSARGSDVYKRQVHILCGRHGHAYGYRAVPPGDKPIYRLNQSPVSYTHLQNCSIWFSTVLRGDVNSIRMGDGVNIQDGSVLHTLYEKSTIEIGNYVSVGHNVTIHGATVKDYALIGMGSTLLDHAVIGEGAIVAGCV